MTIDWYVKEIDIPKYGYITLGHCDVHRLTGVGLDSYINPGYGLSLVDTLWNASSCRQPLEQEGNPMT